MAGPRLPNFSLIGYENLLADLTAAGYAFRPVTARRARAAESIGMTS